MTIVLDSDDLMRFSFDVEDIVRQAARHNKHLSFEEAKALRDANTRMDAESALIA